MFRRVIATALWAYFGWYLAGLLAVSFGLPQAIGPLGGIAMAAVAGVDWRNFLRAHASVELKSVR
jgi:hypothetical protein